MAIVLSFLKCGEARLFSNGSRRLRSILQDYDLFKYDLCPFWSYIYFRNITRAPSANAFSSPFLMFTTVMQHWRSNKPSMLVHSINLTGYLRWCKTYDLDCLRYCPAITVQDDEFISSYNIRSLGLHQTEINLSNCRNIEYVGHLGNVPRLILQRCTGITGINDGWTKLWKVKELYLDYCDQLEDADTIMFTMHTVLSLSYCSRICEVNHFANIKHLNLSFCTRVSDVSSLGNQTTLNLEGCLLHSTSVFHLKNTVKFLTLPVYV
jgi:hypothetical protein